MIAGAVVSEKGNHTETGLAIDLPSAAVFVAGSVPAVSCNGEFESLSFGHAV
jgi:hypothetical protein